MKVYQKYDGRVVVYLDKFDIKLLVGKHVFGTYTALEAKKYGVNSLIDPNGDTLIRLEVEDAPSTRFQEDDLVYDGPVVDPESWNAR